jgi:hypothetical protein
VKRYRLFVFLGLGLLVLGSFLMWGPRHLSWNFANSEDALEWEMKDLRLEKRDNGLRVQTGMEGALRLPSLSVPLRNFITLTLSVVGERPVKGTLLMEIDPPIQGKDLVNMPFEFPLGRMDGNFSLASIPPNESAILSILLLLEGEQDFVLSSILLEHRSILADLRTLLRSYWTFDSFSPTTVNLLVGPHLTKDPTHIPLLFPRNAIDLTTPSANIAWYWAIAFVVGIGAGFGARRRQCGKDMLTGFFIAVSVAWILSDIRMGAEMVSYAKRDYDSYISQPGETRTVRDFGRIYDFAEFVRNTIPRGSPYNLATPNSSPYVGIVRYATVPSVPLFIQNTKDATYPLWVFYDVVGVEFREGRLYIGDAPITASGSMLGVFDEGSFIFKEGV